MISQANIEKLFLTLDQSANLYQHHEGQSYLEGILKACGNILANDVALDLDESLSVKLKALLDPIRDVDFQKEEIRKAYQLAMLKAMKQESLSNENITPDTIGIFIAFLTDKFYPDGDKLTLFDSLAGTANLLVTVANNIKAEAFPVGVESDYDLYRSARALLDMTDYADEIYYQDTFSFSGISARIMVTDFPADNDASEAYFPYRVLLHHHQNLEAGGMVFAIVTEDFFSVTETRNFKNDILEHYHPLGLIRLPRDIFRSCEKSILILKKKTEGETLFDKFLLVDIPSFEDRDEMQKIIMKINHWFDDIESRKGRV